MKERDEVYRIINSNVLQISQQVAGISLAQAQLPQAVGDYTLHLRAVGTYQLDLYLYTDEATLARMASNMKREKAGKEEIPLYATEFFNILGGHIVSSINRTFRQSARFSPPTLRSNEEGKKESGDAFTLFYCYLGGNMKIEGQFVNNRVL